MGFLQVYIYFIAAALLVSIPLLKKNLGKDSYLKLFTPFLLFILVVEVYASYQGSKDRNNVTMLNFLNVLEFCFYLYLFTRIISNLKARKIIRAVLIVYPVLAVSNILWIQGPNKIHTVTYSLGCLLIVACCIFYFLELFSRPKSGSLLRSPSFWMCFGLLLFYSISFPLIGLINYWMHISKFLIHNFFLILNTLNILLYFSLIIAFLCRIRAPKYTS